MARTIALDLVGRDLLSKSLQAAGASAQDLNRKLNELNKRINVEVGADTGRARAELDETKRSADRLDGKRADVKIDADVDGAISGLRLVGMSLAALAAIPTAATVGVGILSLVPASMAAAAGVGALAAVAIPAFSEIKAALQAQTTAQNQAGAAAVSAQGRQLALAGAQQQVAAAVRQASYAHAQALEQVRQAEETYRNSVTDEINAQRDLARARQEAAAQLQAASDNTADARLSERQATFDLADAQANYNKVVADPKANADQKARAQLQLDQARQALKERHEATVKAIADENAAKKAGVEGSDAVRQARQRLTQAEQKETDAERALAAARANVARVDQQSADQVASAQRSLAAAALQGAGANSALNAAMANLSPSAKALMGHWTGLTGAFKSWRLSMEPTVLPIFGRGLDIIKSQIPSLTPMVKGAAGVFSGFVDDVARGAKSPFWAQFKGQITALIPKSLTAGKQVFEDVAVGIMHIVQAFLPYAPRVLDFMTRISGAFRSWATNLPNSSGFQALIAYVKTNGPQVGQTVKEIASALGHVAAALAPIAAGGGMGALSTMQLLSQVIRGMSPGEIRAIALAFVGIKSALAIKDMAQPAVAGFKAINLAMETGGAKGPLFARGLVLAGKGVKDFGIGSVTAIGRVRDGFKDANAAQSAFSGKAGSLGGILRRAVDGAGSGWSKLVGGAKSAAGMVGTLSGKLLTAGKTAASAAIDIGQLGAKYAFMGLKAAWSAVQLVAVKVAQLAVRAATMAWTAVQWALDAAMSANPITLVVIALAALAAGVIYAYTHFQWFRQIVDGAWNGIKTAAQAAWNGVIKPVFTALSDTVTKGVGPVFTWLWKNVVSPAVHGIKKAISDAWSVTVKPVLDAVNSLLTKVIGPVFTWLWKNVINPVWSGIKKTIADAWNYGVKPIFNGLKTAVGTVADAFGTAIGAIKKVWDKLINIAKTPVNFVIGVYNKGIKPLVNGIASLVGLGSPLGKINYFATGGIYPGYTPGKDVGLAAVSGGEAIMRPEWTKAVGSRWVHAGNRIARSRGVSGVRRWLAGHGDPLGAEGAAFASGGIVGQMPAYAGAFDIGGIVSGFLNKAKDWVLDNAKAAARAALKGIFGGGVPGTGFFRDVIAGMPNWVINSLTGWLGDKAGGGTPGMHKALDFAKAQSGKPYIWGGVGPGGYDCSGFMSAIVNVIKGRNPYSRLFSTMSFGASGPEGFVRNKRSGFMVGVTDAGVGHMAGTLLNTNVESSGSIGPHYGAGARGYDNPLFNRWYGLQADTGHLTLQPGWNPPVYNGTGRPEHLSTNPRLEIDFVGAAGDPFVEFIKRVIRVRAGNGPDSVQKALGPT